MDDTKSRDVRQRWRPVCAAAVGGLAALALTWSGTARAQFEEREVEVEPTTPTTPEVEVEVEEEPTTRTTVIEQEPVEEVDEEEEMIGFAGWRNPDEWGWRVDMDFYGFAPGRVQGAALVDQQVIDFDFTAEDIFDELELGGGARFEAWMGPVGLILDATYLQLENQDVTGLDGLRADFTSRQFHGDAMLGLQLFNMMGQMRGRTMGIGLEVGAGVRGVYIDQELEVGTFQMDANDGFAKFVSMVELPIRLADNWGLRGRGSLAVPDPTWTAIGMLEYLGTPVTLGLGYRFDAIDRENGDVAIDVDTHSLYLSLGLRFGDQ